MCASEHPRLHVGLGAPARPQDAADFRPEKSPAAALRLFPAALRDVTLEVLEKPRRHEDPATELATIDEVCARSLRCRS